MKHQAVFAATLACSLTLLPLAGCHVSSHGRDGKEDVDVSTPLGAFAVKTDTAGVLAKVGLPQYPGSTAVQDKGNDKDSADVNMSFGSFHLRVLALSLQSSDDPAKIEGYYRKALSQYSDVIACRNDRPVGEPTRTGLGLSCQDGDKHVNMSHSSGKKNSDELQLKAGSAGRQHIVALEPRDGGTRIALIALDLPHEDK